MFYNLRARFSGEAIVILDNFCELSLFETVPLKLSNQMSYDFKFKTK